MALKDSPSPSAVAVFVLGSSNLPAALGQVDKLTEGIPGVSEFKLSFTGGELLTHIERAQLAVVVLCIGDQDELLEVMDVLKTLQPKSQEQRLKVLVFNSLELATIHSLLLAKGCEVLPPTLSRGGLITKIHYNARLLQGLDQSSRPTQPDQWVIKADPEKPATPDFLVKKTVATEVPKPLPPSGASFRDSSLEYASGAAAFHSLKLRIVIYPDMDPSRPGTTAACIEHSEGTFVLDVPIGLGRVGESLIADLICEGAYTTQCRIELRVKSEELTGDGHKLLFTSVVNGDTKRLLETTTYISNRQEQVLRFLKEAKGF